MNGTVCVLPADLQQIRTQIAWVLSPDSHDLIIGNWDGCRYSVIKDYHEGIREQWGPALAGAPASGHLETCGTEDSTLNT